MLLPSEGELTPTMVAAAVVADRLTHGSATAARRWSSASPASKRRRPRGRRRRGQGAAHAVSSAPAARTTPRPRCPKAAARWPASAATAWRCRMPDRRTATISHMGGEGVGWIGQAPFTSEQAHLPESRRRHLLPFRPAGDPRRRGRRRQHHLQDPLQRRGRDDRRPAGRRRPDRAADRPPGRGRGRQEGRRRHRRARQVSRRTTFRAGVTVHHRDELDAVQRELREVPGLTVLIYDQTCAAEKRRRRKRGALSRSAQARVHQRARSAKAAATARRSRNCVSVQPLETELGRKRQIDQSQLQQGLLLPQGLLPELRHRAWRHARARPNAPRPIRRRCSPICRMPTVARARRRLRHPGHRHRRHRRHHHRRAARHGGPSRRQGLHRRSTSPAWRRRTAR